MPTEKPNIKEVECPILTKHLTGKLIFDLRRELGENYKGINTPSVPGKVLIYCMPKKNDAPNIEGIKCPEYNPRNKHCLIISDTCYLRDESW